MYEEFPLQRSQCTIYLEPWRNPQTGGEIPVVIKAFLESNPAAHAEGFLHEAAARASTGVVNVYSVSVDRGRVQICMEYCSNGSLAMEIKRRQDRRIPFELHFLLGSLRSLLCTLKDIHSVHIAHKAISSENCLLFSDFSIKLTDFGAGELIQPGPDASNRQKAYAEDVFALGKMIYEMAILGQYRFEASCAVDMQQQGISSKLRLFGYSVLSDVLIRMLSPHTETRIGVDEALEQVETLFSSIITPTLDLSDVTGETISKLPMTASLHKNI